MTKLIKQYTKRISILLIILLLMGTVHSLQTSIDTKKTTSIHFEDMNYLPNGTFLKGASLSYDEAVADLLWIKALTYFGIHSKTDQKYDWLYHIIDITTTLDPFFQDPYEFGGIVLISELGNVNGSNEILLRGMAQVPQTHPRYWLLPFFLAFNHMYHKNDYREAAKYLEMASRYPQSPDYLPLLVTRLYANTNNHQVAITFLREMINSTESPELQEKLIYRVKELIADQHIRELETARDQFFKALNRYPTTIAELHEHNFITAIPKEPFGGDYYISRGAHAIYSSNMPEKLIVHIDKDEPATTITIKPRKK